MTLPTDPRLILLATDMSARCDRALDRARQLAESWKSRLLVVHALEPIEADQESRLASRLPSWRRPEQHATVVEQALRDDLAAEGIAAEVKIGEGFPATLVLETARREVADLVITGLARDDPYVRRRLGTLADSLLRDALEIPVLLVRRRARGIYRHIVITTDFSAASRHALETALRWFGDSRMTLFHAYRGSSGGADGDGRGSDKRAEASAREQGDKMLADMALSPEVAQRITRVFENGSPEALLPDYVRHMDVDLAVLGSTGRTGFMRTLMGSTAESLLHQVECDALVVRERS